MQVNSIEARIAELEAQLEAAAVAHSEMLVLVSKWDPVTGETTYYERPTGRKPSWRNASPELYAELEQARRELYQQTVEVFIDNTPHLC
jgi:hypothetical protein